MILGHDIKIDDTINIIIIIIFIMLLLGYYYYFGIIIIIINVDIIRGIISGSDVMIVDLLATLFW